MKLWLYVICEVVDGHPSFRHRFVEASSEQNAYARGQNLLEQPKRGSGLNDYVVELGQFPATLSEAMLFCDGLINAAREARKS